MGPRQSKTRTKKKKKKKTIEQEAQFLFLDFPSSLEVLPSITPSGADWSRATHTVPHGWKLFITLQQKKIEIQLQ